MKRKSEPEPVNAFTLKKIRYLDEEQINIASLVISKLEENKIDTVKFLLTTCYTQEKEIAALLSYTNYKPMKLAIEQQNFELIRYFIEHNTSRGKFLALCYNNYENIKKFIKVFLKSNSTAEVQDKDFMDILGLFIDVNSDKIAPVVLNIVDQIEQKQNITSTPKPDIQESTQDIKNETVLDNVNNENYFTETLGTTEPYS